MLMFFIFASDLLPFGVSNADECVCPHECCDCLQRDNSWDCYVSQPSGSVDSKQQSKITLVGACVVGGTDSNSKRKKGGEICQSY